MSRARRSTTREALVVDAAAAARGRSGQGATTDARQNMRNLSLFVYVLLAYWEKRERQARFLGPWGPYHSAQSEKPVNESSERMGQSSLPRSLGSRDCARDCGRELASESFLRSHLSSASFSSLESRYQTPSTLRPEQRRGPFPSRPEPGRQRPGALHSSLRLTASSYRLHGCPLHCRSSAHAGQQGARHQFG